MKKIMYAFLGLIALASCKKEETPTPAITAEFTVTIENVSVQKSNLISGIFNTPTGDSNPGPATAGKSYQFSFNAGKGQAVSFATMFVQSNDLFYAPNSGGIALYDAMGNARTGNITAEVMLWDAGTEVNMEPGIGMDQAPRQSGANTGTSESNPVMIIADVNDGFSYPITSEVIKVMLSNDGGTMFTISIENISANASIETPLAPGVFVVHNEGNNPIFNPGMLTTNGLEALAEDGDPSAVSMSVGDDTGYWSPFAPGVFAIHTSELMPIYTNDAADNGMGLENLAEDGDPTNLIAALMENPGVKNSGVFNTPNTASMPGPLLPNNSYSFTFMASESERLSLATMLVQSNDLFIGFDDNGIELFSNGQAINGDLTNKLTLWDAGTEINEYPGAGNNQPLRQNGANSGLGESGAVLKVADEFMYPSVNQLIKISISSK